MAEFAIGCLVERGYQPIVAYYQPYSVEPNLSVPVVRLLRGSVGTRSELARGGLECHGIGAWLPELEFTHYIATSPWRRLIEQSDYAISVSGNVLAATPLLQSSRPFLSWVATGWAADRKDRVAATFPWARKLIDRTIVAPVVRRLERRVLQAGHVLALSAYTEAKLNDICARVVTRDVLRMPVDTELFRPCRTAVERGRIGFSGRLSDPRKNIELLVRATSVLASRKRHVHLDLIGGEVSETTRNLIVRLGLADRVQVIPYLSRERLAQHLKTLDVYVVPSHQEGLCIAAIEAMAAGCPIVSTRCGGPEEFVRDGDTGFLVDFRPEAMADAIDQIVENTVLRARLAEGSRGVVEQSYTYRNATETFWRNFAAAFPS